VRSKSIPSATATISSSQLSTPLLPVSSVTSQTLDINNNKKKCSKAAIAYKDISNQIKQIIQEENDEQQIETGTYLSDELMLPEALTHPPQSQPHMGKTNTDKATSAEEKEEGGMNIFNNLQNLETTNIDPNVADFSAFSPNSFLKHFNILSPAQDEAQLINTIQESAATEDPPIAPLMGAKTTLATQQLTPLEAVVEETVQTLDFDWNKSPDHHPVMLPISTILRTNSWYYINNEGVMSATLEYGHREEIQGDIIGEYGSKLDKETQTMTEQKEAFTQHSNDTQIQATQTVTTGVETASQTQIESASKETQATTETRDAESQCISNSTVNSMDMSTNTPQTIHVPMVVTLNMGDAHEAPRWEWP
jgi:hypothetical protein